MLPLDEPIGLQLVDPRALSTGARSDRTWSRLVDVRAGLSRRHYAGPGVVVLEIDDERCGWNSGRVALDIDAEGRAEVTATTRPATAHCGPGALASLYAGAATASELARAGRLEVTGRDEAARLDRIFRVAPAPFCSSDC
jgi:predicted acetyltransferase